jgi:hypothetical protein
MYLLTAVGLSPGGSTHLHTNNTQNNTNNNRTTQITTNVDECGPCPVFASFTLAFALQLRKKHGKTSVRVRKASVRVQYTYYQNTHTLTSRPPPHTHTHTHTHTHIVKQYITTTVQKKPPQYREDGGSSFPRYIDIHQTTRRHVSESPYPDEWIRETLRLCRVNLRITWLTKLSTSSVLQTEFGFFSRFRDAEVSSGGIESRWGRDFKNLSRPSFGSTQPHVKFALGLFPGDKAAGA